MSTKIGFILLSNSKKALASTRISVLNMLPYLRDAGFVTEISYEPESDTETPELSELAERMARQRIEIAYFQKVHGPSVIDAARKLSSMGIKTVYGVCDIIDNKMAKVTDVTIVVTDYLKSLYDSSLQSKIRVVHDGIERPEIFKRKYGTEHGSAKHPLRAVLVTSKKISTIPVIKNPPKYFEIAVIGYYPPSNSILQSFKRAYWEINEKPNFGQKVSHLKSFLDRGFRKINWDIDKVHKRMVDFDIGIIPVDTQFDRLAQQNVSAWQVKSENRLTMKMALGLPVICSPVPSYDNVIVQGENGYIAQTREAWIQYMEELRIPEKRESIGRKARESVIHRYSKEEQARKLIEVLNSLVKNVI
jgi:glycosyltransferase involved in cell wall biosynthesis